MSAPGCGAKLLDIPSNQVREVALTGPDGAVLRVAKSTPEQENFGVLDVPRGRSVQSEFVANGLASTLAGLVLDDVARAGDDAGPASHRGRYLLFDGRVVELRGWRGGTDAAGNALPSWLTIEVGLDEAAARDAIVARSAPRRRSRAPRPAMTRQRPRMAGMAMPPLAPQPMPMPMPKPKPSTRRW